MLVHQRDSKHAENRRSASDGENVAGFGVHTHEDVVKGDTGIITHCLECPASFEQILRSIKFLLVSGLSSRKDCYLTSTRPSAITKTRSYEMMVLNRCAMHSSVRSPNSSRIVS